MELVTEYVVQIESPILQRNFRTPLLDPAISIVLPRLHDATRNFRTPQLDSTISIVHLRLHGEAQQEQGKKVAPSA